MLSAPAETSLNARAEFLGLEAWDTIPFLLRGKHRTASSTGYVLTVVWMCLCKDPLLIDRAAVASFAVCTKASWSCMPASILFDFTVIWHFKSRGLLTRMYWRPVTKFSARPWVVSSWEPTVLCAEQIYSE